MLRLLLVLSVTILSALCHDPHDAVTCPEMEKPDPFEGVPNVLEPRFVPLPEPRNERYKIGDCLLRSIYTVHRDDPIVLSVLFQFQGGVAMSPLKI